MELELSVAGQGKAGAVWAPKPTEAIVAGSYQLNISPHQGHVPVRHIVMVTRISPTRLSKSHTSGRTLFLGNM